MPLLCHLGMAQVMGVAPMVIVTFIITLQTGLEILDQAVHSLAKTDRIYLT